MTDAGRTVAGGHARAPGLEVRFIAFLLGAAVILWFLTLIEGIVLPFLTAFILAYLANPVIVYFESQGLRRGVVLLCLSIGAVVLLVWSVPLLLQLAVDEVVDFKTQLPSYMKALRGQLKQMEVVTTLDYPLPLPRNWSDLLMVRIQDYGTKVMAESPRLILNLFGLATFFILVPVLTIFVLLGYRQFFRWLLAVLPSRYAEPALSVICEVDVALGGYVRGKILETIVMSVLATMGFFWIGVDQPILMGLLNGVACIVPIIGPLLAAIPAVLASLLRPDGLSLAGQVLILVAALRLIDDFLLQALVVGKTVELNPFTIVFAVLAGAEIAGVWGMILAIPVVSIVKVIFQIALEHSRRSMAIAERAAMARGAGAYLKM